MPTEENPNAGQGPVVLDIGGDIGALIVTMPAYMDGLEVEIIPSGTDARPAADADLTADHHHGDDDHHHQGDDGHHHHHGDDGHHHSSDHGHQDHHDHQTERGAPPHVAVVARPAPDGSTIHSLVYGELREGTYDLYVRPHGPVRLTAMVTGAEVTELRWPDWEPPN